MGDNKYVMFYNNICTGLTSSVYYGWEEEELNELSSSERTIYYDSNIAFTRGDKSIVSSAAGDEPLLAVPDLYGTLKGLNDRINTLSGSTGEVSSADALLHVNIDRNTEYIISPGNGTFNEPGSGDNDIANGSIVTPNSISLQSTSSSKAKFTVNGDDFVFKVKDNEYTLTDILTMIEELRARTEMFKTNITRNTIDLSDVEYKLNANVISET